MNLRTLRIGARLCLGLGVILLLATAMLMGTMMSSAFSRDALLQTLQGAAQREEEAVTMRRALLESAIAIRDMGLHGELEAVQKDEARARKARSEYFAAQKRLAALDLAAEERQTFERLALIDREIEARLKEAADLAALFEQEQAAKVITEKLDPLLTKSVSELSAFAALQKQRTAEATAEANAQSALIQRITVAAFAGMLALAVLIAWRLTMSITRPLQLAVAETRRVAAGDLTHVVDVEGKDEIAGLLRALQDMRGSLERIVSDVRFGTDAITTASAEIASGNADLSSRTEQQASSLEETASSMEELTGTVKQNADNARQANQLAAGASTMAVKGGEVVGQVVNSMASINESSKKIADIIGVIDGIAFQTNILALNAAVEAARAGEQGRGFAVVASEVRTLAQRSAAAAKEIKALITDSVAKVDGGSKLVDQAGHTMEEIVTAVKRVTDIMAEIAAASQEQTSGIEQVNQAITQMDQVTQQNAALVEEAAAAAESMQEQAQSLTKAVAIFKLASAESARHPTHRQKEPTLSIAAAQAHSPSSRGRAAEGADELTRDSEGSRSLSSHARATRDDDWGEEQIEQVAVR